MASRFSKQRSVPEDNPFNWTTLYLKRKLVSIGMKVPDVLPKHSLRQLYMNNAPSRSSRPADHHAFYGRRSSIPLPQLTTRRSRCSATIVHSNRAEGSNAAETAIQCNIPEVRATSNMAAVAENMSSSSRGGEPQTVRNIYHLNHPSLIYATSRGGEPQFCSKYIPSYNIPISKNSKKISHRTAAKMLP
ncbi:hypothetical protein ACJMK2_030757 [Sinanodonta woodiana]|uniref:Uncharacterized protein n=1 Tax=Sinanodonta woodiana TaxID=1069815 RepID=A0ABD3WWQ3_SINWO